MARSARTMSNDDLGRAEGDGRPSHSGNGAHVVHRRRALPGSRAVVGGLLIALAAVVAFWSYSRGTQTPHQLYVVATHDLQPGERLSAGDIAVVPLDITNSAVRRQVFGSPAELLDAGATVVAPVSAGALIESSQVVGRGGPAGTRELSLDIDRSRAVGGTIKPGEFVDVLATFGSGSSAYTAVVVPHVEVLTDTPDANGSGGTTELIVFAVSTAKDAEAMVDASIAAQVTLVRSAEQPSGSSVTTVAPYQAPSPSNGA